MLEFLCYCKIKKLSDFCRIDAERQRARRSMLHGPVCHYSKYHYYLPNLILSFSIMSFVMVFMS